MDSTVQKFKKGRRGRCALLIVGLLLGSTPALGADENWVGSQFESLCSQIPGSVAHA